MVYFTQQKLPKNQMNIESVSSKDSYRAIKSYLLDEGTSRQNLATFCQTYMDDDAVKLISETLDKNAVDKSEYPRTAKLENYCINILADLWNAKDDFLGTSTIGSSEACMLAGLAMKFRWRELSESKKIDVTKKKPNLVISSGYQVCWEKFSTYFDVELREVPIDLNHLSINTDQILNYVDEYTIGIVGILGITYTGKFDDIKKLDSKVEEYNKKNNGHLVIHVDAASGGMVSPFIDPKLEWDFRLKNVVSINTSGHKYGLVYPGVGWIIWKSKEYLSNQLLFEVGYLGGSIPTISINFSKNASPIIAQYYMFLKLGKSGYKKVHQATRDVAMYISSELTKLDYFDIINTGDNIPIVCYSLKSDQSLKWDLHQLESQLLMKGWQVPAYSMPKKLEMMTIQRFVCRADLTFPMAEELIEDVKQAILNLEK